MSDVVLDGHFELLAPTAASAPAAAPANVSVSTPVQRAVDGRLDVLGQFSAVQHLQLRAQVGGTLAQIGFKTSN